MPLLALPSAKTSDSIKAVHHKMRLASEIGYDNRAAVRLLEPSVVQLPPLQVSWRVESVCCKKYPSHMFI